MSIFTRSVFALLLISSSVTIAESYQQLLEEGMEVRRTNPTRLNEIINMLDSSYAELEVEEKNWFYYLKGYQAGFLQDIEVAESYWAKVLKLSNNNKLRFKTHMGFVNLYAISKQYEQSLLNLNDGIEELSKVNEPIFIEQGKAFAAILYNQLGQYEIARQYAEELINSSKDPRRLCAANQLVVEASYYLEEYASLDSEQVDKAISLCRDNNELLIANAINIFKIWNLHKNQEYSEALSLLNQNKDEVLSTKYPRLIDEMYLAYSSIYQSLGDIKQSDDYAEKIITNKKPGQNSHVVSKAYENLSNNALNMGDVNNAFEYYKKFTESDKEYQTDKSLKQVAFELARHQIAEKNQEIELLNKENEVLTLEQDLASQSAQNNKLMVLLLIFVLATLAFWSYRVKRNQIEFKRRSETDALTGVSSRHHFYSACRQTLKDAEQREQEVSFILFDMDRFKSVNDDYGHLVGDWVLRKAIEVSRPCWRQNDIAGRLGGEEFALMLPTCNLDKAVEIAENCRKAIEAVDTTESGYKFNISASFGVTTSKISGYDFSKLIGDSDKIMYQAKAAGKNQVFQVANKS